MTSVSSNKRIMWLLQSFVYLGVIVSLLDWPCALGIPMKTGKCPQIQPDFSIDGICPEECLSDIDCPDDLKCCSYGCGHVCMKPDPDICNQPKDVGPCDAYIPRWFFNVASGLCESFIYGGCPGNDNNFRSKSECEKACGGSTEPDICNQPKDAGPCKGYFPRWFFNAASRSCEKFIYGGCPGNDNNFGSQKECEYKCGARTSHCPPGTTESKPAVYCGRGGTPCEDGYHCVIAPNDAYAVCCSDARCPNGEPVVNCLRDPCEDAVCNAHPNAECTANYCGGCNTDWTVDGKPVDCGRWGK